MSRFNIPGAVYVVVKDGNIIFKSGYGYADLESKTLVNPDTTGFTIGSVSKLFTTSALLKLKEQGKVDFKEDINTYLKGFKINYPFPKSITIENLLTHTAGFDERTYQGDYQNYLINMETLFENSVLNNIPRIIREPGQIIQYSNYGFDVAGYIVKEVSGMKFTEYMQNNILDPLNMKRSSYDVTQEVLVNSASGYYYSKNKYNKLKFNKVPALGSGGLISTGSDMGNFLSFLLQKGTYNGQSILSEKSISDMQTRHFSNGKLLNGVCYSFFERTFNGFRILEHGGADLGFKSDLKIIPEAGIGYFVSVNADPYGQGSQQFVDTLFSEFMKSFYPANMSNNQIKYGVYNPTYDELKKFEGNYSVARVPLHSLGKIISLLSYNEYKVKAEGDQLQLSIGDWTGKYKMIGYTEFVNNNSGGIMAFVPGKNGNTKYLSFGQYDTYTKIPWYETKSLHLKLLLFLSLIFFINLFFIPYVLIRKRLNNKKIVNSCGLLTFIISSINIGFIVSFLVYFSSVGLIEILVNIKSLFIKFLLTMPLISILLTLFFLILLIIGFRKKAFSKFYGIYYCIVLICSVGFILFLNHWCLVGYRY